MKYNTNVISNRIYFNNKCCCQAVCMESDTVLM